jgi:hypothetical protein
MSVTAFAGTMGKVSNMTTLKQARESASSILGIIAPSNARSGKVVRVSQLAPALAASPSLNLKAGIAYAVGQGWIRDWGRAIVLTEKGLAASASLNAQEKDQGKGARFMNAAGLDRAFRSIVIPPRPPVKKPTAGRG